MSHNEVNKTTRKALVQRVDVVKPHPNGDNLEICQFDEWVVVSQKGLYKVGDLVVHIQPDSIVNTDRPEFRGFRRDGGEERVKVVKLRGIHSMGFVIPCPDGFKEGDDCADYLGVKHYQPQVQSHG